MDDVVDLMALSLPKPWATASNRAMEGRQIVFAIV